MEFFSCKLILIGKKSKIQIFTISIFKLVSVILLCLHKNCFPVLDPLGSSLRLWIHLDVFGEKRLKLLDFKLMSFVSYAFACLK